MFSAVKWGRFHHFKILGEVVVGGGGGGAGILQGVSVEMATRRGCVMRMTAMWMVTVVVDTLQVILKEREEKKRMRLIGDCDVYADVDIPDDPDPDEPDPDAIHPENDLLDDSNAG